MEAISPRGTLLALVLLACLVGAAGAALPAQNGTATTAATVTVANATAAVTPLATAAVPTRAPVAANATLAPFTLVLDLDRSPAAWGDTVRCSGTGAGNATVALLVDGVAAGTAVPDAAGAYRFDLLVDRLPAGTHVVRAEAGPLRSAEASLEVVAIDPVILLAVEPTEWENETALFCSGNVTAEGRPVPGAAVRLVFDGTGTADVTTGPEGQDQLLAGISGGSHEVVANVSFDDGRPLNPATSGVVKAELPGGFPLLPVLGGIVLVLAGAGGFLYWRRSRSGDGARLAVTRAVPAPRPVRAEPVAAPVVEAVPAPTAAEDLRAAAQALAGDGGRDGIAAVYRELVARLAAAEPGARLGSMTPRELAAHFAGTPAGVAVARVATCYEAVAYTGRTPTPADVEIVVEGFVAALSELGRAGR